MTFTVSLCYNVDCREQKCKYPCSLIAPGAHIELAFSFGGQGHFVAARMGLDICQNDVECTNYGYIRAESENCREARCSDVDPCRARSAAVKAWPFVELVLPTLSLLGHQTDQSTHREGYKLSRHQNWGWGVNVSGEFEPNSYAHFWAVSSARSTTR